MFYLVLRGLVTIEDDMTIPNGVKGHSTRKHLHLAGISKKMVSNEKVRQLPVEYDTTVKEAPE